MTKKHLLFPLAIVVLLFVSCDKGNVSVPQDSTGAASYDERDWDWNKQTDGGLQIEIAWGGGDDSEGGTATWRPGHAVVLLSLCDAGRRKSTVSRFLRLSAL